MKTVIGHLRRAALLRADGLSDGRLLELYLSRREEAAFETLLARHGPMVLGVCRRVLGNSHDAEDAFQATFLVLARKAASVQPREAVGSWLYGVAYRTALKARAMNAKRRSKEEQACKATRPDPPGVGDREELCEHLDAELSRLPDRYRVPLVLCELEGKSRKEVARLLAIPEGTLSWRLAQGRKLLARRLSRHGRALSATALAALLAGGALGGVPRALLAATAQAAVQATSGRALKAGVVSAQVIALTEGVLKTMLLMKLKVVCVLAVILTLGAGGVGWSYRAGAAPPAQAGEQAKVARSLQDELEELRLEVAALRKGLESTRQRVKELENEARAARETGRIQAREQATPLQPFDGKAREAAREREKQQAHLFIEAKTGRADLTDVLVVELLDPLADIEAALKQLRAHPDDKKAAEKLMRAAKTLKDGQGPPAAPPSRNNPPG